MLSLVELWKRATLQNGAFALLFAMLAALLGVSCAPVCASPYTEGQKKVLFIRVDFSDKTGDPLTQAAAETLINTTVNNSYIENSYGKTSLVATVTPTLRMPQPTTYYTTVDQFGNDNVLQLLVDARSAALAAGYDTNLYNLDICAFKTIFGFGGLGYVGAKGTWLNGYFDFRVTAHELGHNLGLYHANLWKTTDNSVIGAGASDEYGDVYDTMGANYANSPETHFNTWFKNRIDWIPAAGVQNVTTSGIYRIQAQDTSAATGLRALKIAKDSSKNYWVEFRSLMASNTALANGALLHWGYNNNTESNLLDTTPGSSGGVSDAALALGKTFSDTAAGIHITPLAKGGASPAWMDVAVNIGSFAGNRAPTVSINPQNTLASIGNSTSFSATATDADGDALSYAWDFGDGTFASTQTATKTWTSNGTYTVSCTVSDRKGGTASATASVTVAARAIVLLAPADNASVSGSAPLRAISNDNPSISRVDFQQQSVQASFTRTPSLTIPDMTTVSDSATVAASGTVSLATVTVDITHSYVGDLTLTLVAPDGTTRVLRQNTGGSNRDIRETYDVSTAMAGKTLAGTWTLRINDNFNADSGVLNSWSMNFSGPWTTIASDTNGVDGNGEWTATWNTIASPNGTYNVRSLATSTAGNLSDSNSNITVSNTSSLPTLSSFTPTSGPVGTQVTLTGTNLSTTSAVAFNGTSAGGVGTGFFVDSATQVRAIVPSGATTGTISVTTGAGTATTSGAFTVLNPATISGFTPASGPVGTQVTITGTNFSGATSVSFNGTSTGALNTGFFVDSATQVRAIVPTGATTGTISITTGAGTATSNSAFTVIPAPTLSGFTPTSGTVGTQITISGANLSGATNVSVNGTSVGGLGTGYFVDSATQIRALVPNGATTGTISVTTGGGTATSSGTFTVISAPTLSGFTPAGGPIGTQVTLTGTNLNGATNVSFNGTSAGALGTGFFIDSSTQVRAIVPNGTTTGTISLTNAAGTATTSSVFTVTGAATLGGFTPTLGPVGTQVTITGTNLTSTTAVSFNGTSASNFVVDSPTQIRAIVPTGATTGTIKITTGSGILTTSGAFTVLTGNSISGRVTTDAGVGVSGVTVARSGATTTTDAAGYYGFSNLTASSAGTSYTLTPTKTDFTFSPTSLALKLKTSAPQIVGADFVALQTKSISGRVIDEVGVPLAGVTLTRSGGGSADVSVTSNAQGYFGFSLVTGSSAGISYTITASKTGFSFLPATATALVKTANVSGLTFMGLANTSISGSITNASGAPIAGVTVKRDGQSPGVVTDAKGNYGFSSVPSGAHTIVVSKTGLTFSPASQNVQVSGANVTGVNFEALFSLTGKVTTGAGVGVSGVTLSATGTYGPLTTTTNSSGIFNIINVRSGSYTLTPSAPNGVFIPTALAVTVTTAGVAQLDFVSLTGNSVSGRITNSGGSAIAGVSVTRTGSASAATTNSGGYYGFSDLADGTYTLSPAKTGLSFNPVTRDATVSGTSVGGLNFTGLTVSATTGSIAGRIVDTNGVGLAGVAVARTGSTSKATTDANGYYGFNSVPASSAGVSYTVTPTKSGYSFSAPSQDVIVKTTQNATNVNFIATEGTISGRITDSNGNGVAGVSVGRSGSSAKVTTDSLGNYRLGLVPSSASGLNYTVTPSKSGWTFNPVNQIVVVTPTQNPVGVDFVALTSFSISGRVTTSDGNGVAGVSLTRSGSATPVVTNSLGYYGFSSVPKGSYTITAAKDGFSLSSSTVMPFALTASKSGVNFSATPLSPIPNPSFGTG